MHKLYIAHDPMCSWCYAFQPTLDRLLAGLPAGIRATTLLGGLAADDADPMPTEMQGYLRATWRTIGQRVPGTQFNFAFWETCTPRRSTYPACRAVLAARGLRAGADGTMLHAIRQAYYREARNPSDEGTLIDLAGEIGLDSARFAARLRDPATQQALEAEIARARELGMDSFPSLRLVLDGGGTWPVAIDYLDAAPMLELIGDLVSG